MAYLQTIEPHIKLGFISIDELEMTTNLHQIFSIFETTPPALHPNFGQAMVEFDPPRFPVHNEVHRLSKGNQTNVAEPKLRRVSQ